MKILVTGGAGFIGTNVVKHFAPKCDKIVVLDDLSRKGTEKNIRYQRENIANLEFVKGSVTNWETVRNIFKKDSFDIVFHLAAQVAVTTSVTDPRSDFEINALGSFNVLEGVRLTGQKPIMLYSSTNKVYGGMEEVVVEKKDDQHYGYRDFPHGIAENFPLDFHSPYGCSKGTGDQYFIDYARIYDFKTVVLRQSCIYGDHQFGNEDQGWVAHFLISAVKGSPLTIFGDGLQVRDVLYVKDLVRCYDMAISNIDKVKGKAFNVGGGADNTLSLLEFIDILKEMTGEPKTLSFDDWRPGDQKVYISDIREVRKVLNWAPEFAPRAGIEELYRWIKDHKEDIL